MDTAEKSMKLLIGDGSIASYNKAKKLFGSVQLLDRENYSTVDYSKNYHVSIKDLEFDQIVKLYPFASQIEVGELTDLSKQERYLTDVLLSKSGILKHTDLLGEVKKLTDRQMVFFGCSHTYGVGVSQSQRYSSIVSNYLGLDETNLAIPHGSIWNILNQFHRCEFQPRQKVVIQIPEPDRFSKFDDENNIIITDIVDNKDKNLILGYTDNIIKYQYYSLVSSIMLSAKQQNLDFVCIAMLNDFEYMHDIIRMLSNFKEYIHLESFCLDYGDDDQHPGPLTHQDISSKILDYYKDNFNETTLQ